MQVVWVQHWSYLPVIVEDIDMSDGRLAGGRLPSTQFSSDSLCQPTENDRSLITCMSTIFHKHPHSILLLTQIAAKAHDFPPQKPPAQGFGPQTLLKAGLIPNMPGQSTPAQDQVRGQPAGAFGMSGLGEALPDYLLPQDEVERSTSGSSAALHQQSPSPFAGQAVMTSPGYGVYSPQYATPYQQAAANAQAYSLSQLNQPPPNTVPNPIQQPYPGHAYYSNQQHQQYLLYPGQYGGQSHQGLPPTFAPPFGRGTNPSFGIGSPQHLPDVAGIPARVPQYGGFAPGGPMNYGYGPGAAFSRPGITPGNNTECF